jgi:hypothetical protein
MKKFCGVITAITLIGSMAMISNTAAAAETENQTISSEEIVALIDGYSSIYQTYKSDAYYDYEQYSEFIDLTEEQFNEYDINNDEFVNEKDIGYFTIALAAEHTGYDKPIIYANRYDILSYTKSYIMNIVGDDYSIAGLKKAVITIAGGIEDTTESTIDPVSTTAPITTTTTTTTSTSISATSGIIPITKGDANRDGSINSIDAVLVLKQYAADLVNGTTFYDEAYDMNSDKKINSIDAVQILQYYANSLLKK